MSASSIRVAPEVNGASHCADKGFLAKPETYDQIYAYARDMEWMEKPFHFVVSRWLDRRSPCSLDPPLRVSNLGKLTPFEAGMH